MKTCYVCKLPFEKLLANKKCSSCMKEYKKKYYQDNKEKYLANKIAWKENNPEKYRDGNKKYAEKNVEKNAERARRWAENNRSRRSESESRRRALKLGTQVEKITVVQLKARLAQHGGVCAYCGDPHEHWDHMTPLSRGGSHTISNLAPACVTCNLSKGSLSYEEWMQKIHVIL